MAREIKKHPIIINIILFLIAVVLQYNGVFSISVFGFSPSLTLSILIPLSMFLSEYTAFFCGLGVGIAVDAFSSTTFGFNSIVYSIIALLVCLVSHFIFNNNFRSNIVLVLAFSFLYYLARWFIFYGFVKIADTLHYIAGVAFPSAVFTAIISIAIYFVQKHILTASR